MKEKTDANFIEENIRRCIKKFCKDLKKLATAIINYKEKKLIPLTDKEIKFYDEQKVCHICEKKFLYAKNKKKRI